MPAACGRGGGTDPDFIPNAPGNFSAMAVGSGRAQVSWTDNSLDEASFVLEHSSDGLTWTDVLVVGPDQTSALVPGLIPGQTNHLQVRAQNVKGRSPPAGPALLTPSAPAWSGPTPGPAPLVWAANAYDSKRHWMLVFGGADSMANQYNTLFALDLNPTPPVWMTISALNAPPSPRLGSSMVYDPESDRLIVFGGQSAATVVAEIWEFSFATALWRALPTIGSPPAARQHHQATYDPVGKRMILCGGQNAGVLMLDTPVLHLASKTNPTWGAFDPIPVPRTRHSAIYDGLGGRVLAFGGSNFMDVFQDVLSLNLTTGRWTSLATQGTPPDPRVGHLAVWDELNHQMVVYAGADFTETPIDDLWSLSLSGSPTWRPLSPAASGPAPVFYAAGVYEKTSGRFYLFGGSLDDTLSTTDETWVLGL